MWCKCFSKKKSNKLGNRVEIKNLNSLKSISKAILYETNRQEKLLKKNCIVIQETRLFNSNSGKTKSIRMKEESNDYRYFPDPDLLPLKISSNFINQIKLKLPESPEDKKTKYIKNYGLKKSIADVLISEKNATNFFEIVCKKINPKLAANWICDEIFARLNKMRIQFTNLSITPNKFCSLLKLITLNKISGKIAKNVLDEMFNKNEDPEQIVKKYNLLQISNKDKIEKYIDQIITSNSKKVKEFKNGKNKLFGYFVGQVMKISKGKANPKRVTEILIKKLKFINNYY